MLVYKDAPLPKGGFIAAAQVKNLVVLHFTAGATASGALAQWNSQLNYVSTPYIVDLNGDVIRTYSEEFWSYHLGEASEDHRNHKRSIAVEIVNRGPLRAKYGSEQLFWWPNDFKTPYCFNRERDKYVTLPAAWHSEKFFAAFTQAQIDAVVELVVEICERRGIPKAIPPARIRHTMDVSWYRNFKGVCSHVNFRADKTDLAPGQSDAIWAGLLAKGFTE